MQGAGDIDLDGSDKLAITLDSSAAFKKFESGAYLTIDGGNLVLVATASKDNKYARVAHSFNSRAGAELLWNLPGGIPGDSLLKQVDDAIGIEKSLTDSNPEYAPAWFNLAYWYAAKNKDGASAQACYDKAIGLGMAKDSGIEKAIKKAS